MTLLTILLIVVGIGITLIILTEAYWATLTAMFPEQLRSQEVVWVPTKDLWELRMCRYRQGRTNGEPILFVHGANTNQHNFTLPEGACLVDYLAGKGYDCWTLDLRGCKSSRPPFERRHVDATMNDMLLHDIPAALNHIRKETGYGRVHYVGHSLGGMLLYAYALRFGTDHLASGTTLGTPVGFQHVRGRFGLVFLPLIRFFPELCGAAARGAVPFAMLFRTAFGVFPVNARNLHPKLDTPQVYNLVENPLPKVLRELSFFIRSKTWRMDGDRLNMDERLPELDLPLLAIFAQNDPLIPLDDAKAFVDRIAATDKKILICGKEHGCDADYGHCDLAFGRNGVKDICQPVHNWIAAHPVEERVRIVDHQEDTAPPEDYVSPLDTIERASILAGASYAHITDGGSADVSLEKEPQADLRDAAIADATPAIPTDAPPEAPAKKPATPRKKPAAKKKAVAAKKKAATAKKTVKPRTRNPKIESLDQARMPKNRDDAAEIEKPAAPAPETSDQIVALEKKPIAKKKRAVKKKSVAKKKTTKPAASLESLDDAKIPDLRDAALEDATPATPSLGTHDLLEPMAKKKPAARKKAASGKKSAAKKKPVAKKKVPAAKGLESKTKPSNSTRSAILSAAADLAGLDDPKKGKK